MDTTSDGNSDSDTSSIEILKALTNNVFQMTDISVKDPALSFFDKMVANDVTITNSNINTGNVNVDYLDKLVKCEENFFFSILVKCIRICPSVFGKQDFCKFLGRQSIFSWKFHFQKNIQLTKIY